VLDDAAPPEIYTLSLHDALPIWDAQLRRLEDEQVAGQHREDPRPGPRASGRGAAPCTAVRALPAAAGLVAGADRTVGADPGPARSEEHTSELQSRENLVCRLLLE